MKVLTSIENFFTKKIRKQNNLFSIFKKYVDVSYRLSNLKNDLKEIEIKKIENQLNEYFVPVADLYKVLDASEVKQEVLLTKVKHISEINPKEFSFIELHASYVSEGILLTAEPTANSDLITIVSFIKK